MGQAEVVQLIVTLGAIIIHYMKNRVDTKVARKNSEVISNNLTIVVGNVEKKLNTLTNKVDGIITSQEDEKALFNAITKKSFDTIAAHGDGLSEEIVHVLNTTQIKIRSFAIKHSNSPYRKNKGAIEDYLKIEAGSIKDDIKQKANESFPGEKGGLDYDSFVYANTNLTPVIGVMIQRLTENGLDKGEYISLFERFISDLFKEQIKGWREWVQK